MNSVRSFGVNYHLGTLTPKGKKKKRKSRGTKTKEPRRTGNWEKLMVRELCVGHFVRFKVKVLKFKKDVSREGEGVVRCRREKRKRVFRLQRVIRTVTARKVRE